MLEKCIEKHLVERVRAVNGLCLKFSPETISGLPDRICLFPHGRICFVELKAPGKKARPLQKIIHDKLRKLGFRVEVIDSFAAVNNLIMDYAENI